MRWTAWAVLTSKKWWKTTHFYGFFGKTAKSGGKPPFFPGSGKLYKALQYSLQVQCSAVQCLAFYTGKYTELHDSRCSGIFRDNFRGRNQFQVKLVIRMKSVG